MINFTGLSHINIVVNNINEGIKYYKKIFSATPLQELANFKNIGFAKSAWLIKNPETVNASIVFLQIPNTNIAIELMEYHSPARINEKKTDDSTQQIGNVGHIALKVNNIEEAFLYLKSCNDVTLISNNPQYKPYKIDTITPNEFKFFDSTLEQNKQAKQRVRNIVSQIKYFYFVDKYGIQWELEQ